MKKIRIIFNICLIISHKEPEPEPPNFGGSGSGSWLLLAKKSSRPPAPVYNCRQLDLEDSLLFYLHSMLKEVYSPCGAFHGLYFQK